MVSVTISRGGTSVDVPVLSTGGQPLINANVGKPNLNIQNTGSINPRSSDFWSGFESYTITGAFTGSNAYSNAVTLADLIKSGDSGSDLTLDIPLAEFDSDMLVAPAAGQEEALQIEYLPGRRTWINVNLTLTRVDSTLGDVTHSANTPTVSGTGPIQLSYDGTSVTLSRDISITRGVGRPQDQVKRGIEDYPYYYPKFKTAFDAFEIGFETGPNSLSKIQDLVTMFNTKLGRDSMTLSFGGIYGLGSFNVVPFGSNALTHSRPAGQQGVKKVPTINLRRVR